MFTSILNRRLSDFVELHSMLADEQAVFRRERSVRDQLFILTEAIKNRRPLPTYCAFIDVAKAYDKVWRDGLWYKLWVSGIRGKMWRILRNIYREVQSAVLVGDNVRTEFFNIDLGLRQGCKLSPLLFALFINDLSKVINDLYLGIKCGGQRISILFFADESCFRKIKQIWRKCSSLYSNIA
jgi:hypothetical protein